jgi:uncharacterized protein YegJ (DUF2314 family)
MIRLLLVLASLTLALPAWAQKADPPELELFSAGDVTMNAAIAEAQRTLPLFLSYVLDASGASIDGSVKVAFHTFPVDQGAEIIWVTAFRRNPDGSFTGRLNHQPFHLGDWRIGDTVTFPASAIEDWSLPDPSGSFGNYTTRVIAAQPGNGHIFQGLSPQPLPSNWQ